MAKAVKKFRKKRQMTEEQKKAASERLAKAREKRMRENPPQYKNIHPSVLELGDDHEWSHVNVKKWIKTQKELLSGERRNVRQKVKGAEAKVASHEAYIRHLETYLRTGNYCDMFWGEYQQNKTRQVCVTMAYNPDGTPKRSYGIYYPDIDMVWGVDNKPNV